MTIGQRPNWLSDSPYFYIDDEGGWALKDDAPFELKKKFKEYMKETDKANRENKRLEIIHKANSEGYDYAILRGHWEDYEVYEPIYWKEERFGKKGLPIFILAKDTEVRFTDNEEESHKIMNEMERNSFDESENDPIELEPNMMIKFFKFERGGFGGNYQLFEFKSNKKDKILTYIEQGEYEPSIKPSRVRIDDEKFDEYALGMIKYFPENLGEPPDFCDGEWYELKGALFSGKLLKLGGYNNDLPLNYSKFINYLKHYWDDSKNIIEYLPAERIRNYY